MKRINNLLCALVYAFLATFCVAQEATSTAKTDIPARSESAVVIRAVDWVQWTNRKKLGEKLPHTVVYNAEGVAVYEDYGVPLPADRKSLTLADLGLMRLQRFAQAAKTPMNNLSVPALQYALAGVRDRRGENVAIAQLGSAKLRVLEYWAEWCKYCHVQTDALQTAMALHPEFDVVLIKLEADAEKSTRKLFTAK
jgi:hypothetical protein